MAFMRILVIVVTSLLVSGLACRAPLKPFVTSSGAISTCRHDGDCPSLYECSLLWLGVKVCCPLPFAPVEKPAAAAEGDLMEGEIDQANHQSGGDPTDPVRYYYVYVTASTPPPPPAPQHPPQTSPEKSWIPNLALTYDKFYPEAKTAAAPPPLPPHIPPPPPNKPQELFQAPKTKDPPSPVPRHPMINFQAPMNYAGEPLAPGSIYNYSPLSASIFDIFTIGSVPGSIRRPTIPQPRGSITGRTAPLTSFLNPYQYASYSYLRPRIAKTD